MSNKFGFIHRADNNNNNNDNNNGPILYPPCPLLVWLQSTIKIDSKKSLENCRNSVSGVKYCAFGHFSVVFVGFLV